MPDAQRLRRPHLDRPAQLDVLARRVAQRLSLRRSQERREAWIVAERILLAADRSDHAQGGHHERATLARQGQEGGIGRCVLEAVHQAIGALGWNEFYAPPLAQLAWIAALSLAVFRVLSRSPDRWWHARWIVAALLLPTIVELVVHGRIGEIWQGRYSIPFAIGGVLYAARSASPSRRLMQYVVFAAALAEVLTLWHTLRRFMVGLDGSLTMRHAEWQPPLNPWLLLAINGAAIAWLAAQATSMRVFPAATLDLARGGHETLVRGGCGGKVVRRTMY